MRDMGDRYEGIYTGHHDFRPLGAPLGEDCLPNAIDLCYQLLNGTYSPVIVPSPWGPGRPDQIMVLKGRNRHAEYATVEALYDELAKITARMDEFDGLYPGHGLVDAGTIMLVNVMEACKAVLDDPECYDWKGQVSRHGVTRTLYRKMIYQSGYLVYSRDKLYRASAGAPGS
jgi:hypothetical protein